MALEDLDRGDFETTIAANTRDPRPWVLLNSMRTWLLLLWNRLWGVGRNVLEYGAATTATAAENTTAIQAAITAAIAGGGGVVTIPPGDFPCNELVITNGVHLTLCGPGRLVWGTTGGIRLSGTCTRVTIRGLRMLGDGVVGSAHRGVYSLSGQTLSQIVVDGCIIQDCMIGVSLNADLGGSLRGCIVRGNRITNVVGTASGQGYGIHVAAGHLQPHGTLIEGNHIHTAHRHSIYIAQGFGCRCVHNLVELHRDDDDTGVTYGAIVVARGGDHFIGGNVITESNNVGLFLDAGSAPGETLRNVTVIGNSFVDPVGAHPHLYVGEDIAPSGDIHGIEIHGNTFDSNGTSVEAIRVHWGHGVAITGNTIRLRGVLGTSYGIRLAANGEVALSATNSSRWLIAHNSIQIIDAGGGASSAAIRLITPFVDDSTVDATFIGNTAIVPGSMFSVGANCENPNISVSKQAITGLTYSVGTAQLGYNEVASALQVTGDLTFLGASSVLQLGLASGGSNAQLRTEKPDAVSQTWLRHQNNGTFIWLGQFDSSENWNILDSSSNVVFQIQRGTATTDRYVRAVSGLRVGATDGPLTTGPTLNTSDGTTATLATVTLADNSAVEICATVVAMQVDGSNRNVYVRRCLVYRDGGGATIQGAVDTERTVESAAAWDCTIDVSGNDARVRVTGAAATDIRWRGRLETVTAV